MSAPPTHGSPTDPDETILTQIKNDVRMRLNGYQCVATFTDDCKRSLALFYDAKGHKILSLTVSVSHQSVEICFNSAAVEKLTIGSSHCDTGTAFLRVPQRRGSDQTMDLKYTYGWHAGDDCHKLFYNTFGVFDADKLNKCVVLITSLFWAEADAFKINHKRMHDMYQEIKTTLTDRFNADETFTLPADLSDGSNLADFFIEEFTLLFPFLKGHAKLIVKLFDTKLRVQIEKKAFPRSMLRPVPARHPPRHIDVSFVDPSDKHNAKGPCVFRFSDDAPGNNYVSREWDFQALRSDKTSPLDLITLLLSVLCVGA